MMMCNGGLYKSTSKVSKCLWPLPFNPAFQQEDEGRTGVTKQVLLVWCLAVVHVRCFLGVMPSAPTLPGSKCHPEVHVKRKFSRGWLKCAFWFWEWEPDSLCLNRSLILWVFIFFISSPNYKKGGGAPGGGQPLRCRLSRPQFIFRDISE